MHSTFWIRKKEEEEEEEGKGGRRRKGERVRVMRVENGRSEKGGGGDGKNWEGATITSLII